MPSRNITKRGAKTASRDFNAGFCPQPAKLSTGIRKEKFLAQSRKGAKRCRVSKGFPLRLCAFAPLRLCAFAPLREKNVSRRHLQLEVKSAMPNPRGSACKPKSRRRQRCADRCDNLRNSSREPARDDSAVMALILAVQAATPPSPGDRHHRITSQTHRDSHD